VDDVTARSTVRPLVVPELVTLPAEIDISNADAVREDLQAALRPGVAVVIADMTSTVFCDSAGLRSLLLASDAARAAGAELRLVIPSAAVLRIMQVAGFDRLLQVYLAMQEALTGAARPRR